MPETLLIVDDAEFMRYVLKDLLLREGIATVAEAGTRDEAMCLGRALRPGLVLVDVSRDILRRLDLLHELAALLPRSRFVAVVCEGDHETLREAGRLGADATLIKPYDPEDVRTLLRHLQSVPATV